MKPISIEGSLTLEQAEHAANSMIHRVRSGGTRHLDLSSLTGFQPGAAVRLGNAFRVVAQHVRELDVVVPGDRSGTEAFTGTIVDAGIGPQLALHASTLRTRRKKQTRTLRKALLAPGQADGRLTIHNLRTNDVFVERSDRAVETFLDQWITANHPAGESARFGDTTIRRGGLSK